MSEQLHTASTPMGDFEDPGENSDEPDIPMDNETISKLKEMGIDFSDWQPVIPDDLDSHISIDPEPEKDLPEEPKWPRWVLYGLGIGLALFFYFMGWI